MHSFVLVVAHFFGLKAPLERMPTAIIGRLQLLCLVQFSKHVQRAELQQFTQVHKHPISQLSRRVWVGV